MTAQVVALVALEALRRAYQRNAEGHMADPDLTPKWPGSSFITQAAYATWSALWGTQGVTLSKCMAHILYLDFQCRHAPKGSCPEHDTDVFLHRNLAIYVNFVPWTICTGVWLYRMNQAISMYDPVLIIPLLQATFILFAAVNSGIFFQGFWEFDSVTWACFTAGVVGIFTGLCLLTPEPSSEPDVQKFLKSLSTIEVLEAKRNGSESPCLDDPDSIVLSERVLEVWSPGPDAG